MVNKVCQNQQTPNTDLPWKGQKKEDKKKCSSNRWCTQICKKLCTSQISNYEDYRSHTIVKTPSVSNQRGRTIPASQEISVFLCQDVSKVLTFSFLCLKSFIVIPFKVWDINVIAIFVYIQAVMQNQDSLQFLRQQNSFQNMNELSPSNKTNIWIWICL